jgi:mRNA interferase YafQ
MARRTINPVRSFQRDYRREKSGVLGRKLADLLEGVLDALADDAPLPDRCRDHPLAGEWAGYRECHVRPDLLLIYRKPDDNSLELVRLGSHSEIFG